jgi:hypothetical protein
MSDWSWLIPAAVLLGAVYCGLRGRRASYGSDPAPSPAVVESRLATPVPTPVTSPPVAPLAARRGPALRPGVAPADRPARSRASTWTERGAARVTAEPAEAVCDGLTGARLDLTQPLWRCTRCRTCYRDDSRRTLQEENGGGCLACGGTNLQRFTPDPAPPAAAPVEGPVTLTAHVCWLGPAAEPGFYVAVLENKSWRQALKLIFPPALTAQPGAMAFIAGLTGREITARGPLATNGPLGPRIIVTDRRMLRLAATPTPHIHRS